MKKTKKTTPETALLIEWMNRLGLQNWSIVLDAYCVPGEMSLAGTLGCTSWEESTRSAVIQIVDPDKLDREKLARDFDFEEVLVHELLHLKFSLLGSKNEEETLSDRILHVIIDDLARAMVGIKKKYEAREKTNDTLSVLRRRQQKAHPQNEASERRVFVRVGL